MGQFSEQLEKYFRETPKEEVDRHFFEFECDWYGIDKNDPHAKRMIKRKHIKENWQRRMPKILLYIDSFCTTTWFICAGSCLGKRLFGLGILYVLFGIVFLYRVIRDAKELYWD